jgi:positive regulator of sigma E activity
MENRNDNDLMMIPEHCSQRGEIVEGFGKDELLQASVFSLIGLIVGIVIMIFWSKEISTIILSIVIGSAGGYIICQKDRYSRQSVLDIVRDYIKFGKSQKYYEYRR